MKINSQREIFYENNTSIKNSSLLREKQGLRFDQKQAQIQAASQISDLIFFGPAYGKLQISRKFSAKRTHSIYKDKRTHLKDPSEKIFES